MARVGIADNENEAEVWRSALEAEGIPSMVRNTSALDYLQTDILPPYDYEVWVPRSALRRARFILRPSLMHRFGPVNWLLRVSPFWAVFAWALMLLAAFVTVVNLIQAYR